MSAAFQVGDRVRVHAWTPPGHVRTPFFTRGKTGEIASVAGAFGDPEELAYGRKGRTTTLYRVRFAQAELWSGYAGAQQDTLVADIFEHWLEKADG